MHGNGASRHVSTLIESHRSFWVDLGAEATEGTRAACQLLLARAACRSRVGPVGWHGDTVARFVFKADRLSRVAQVATLLSDVTVRTADDAQAAEFARRLELGLKSIHSFDKVGALTRRRGRSVTSSARQRGSQGGA